MYRMEEEEKAKGTVSAKTLRQERSQILAQGQSSKSPINAYMWNPEKRWINLLSRNRDTEVENKHMDTKGVQGVR